MTRPAIIVDDSRAMRAVLRRWLTDLGFEVTEAEHGVEALQHIDDAHMRPALMLVDWNMPVMDGLALVKEVRRRETLSGTVIVMVSAENDRTRIARALMAGADEYAMKPVTFDVLIDKLTLAGALG